MTSQDTFRVWDDVPLPMPMNLPMPLNEFADADACDHVRRGCDWGPKLGLGWVGLGLLTTLLKRDTKRGCDKKRCCSTTMIVRSHSLE
jgi:hypothetical protein